MQSSRNLPILSKKKKAKAKAKTQKGGAKPTAKARGRPRKNALPAIPEQDETIILDPSSLIQSFLDEPNKQPPGGSGSGSSSSSSSSSSGAINPGDAAALNGNASGLLLQNGAEDIFGRENMDAGGGLLGHALEPAPSSDPLAPPQQQQQQQQAVVVDFVRPDLEQSLFMYQRRTQDQAGLTYATATPLFPEGLKVKHAVGLFFFLASKMAL